MTTKACCLYYLLLTASPSPPDRLESFPAADDFDPFPYSCYCPSVPGKSINQTQESLTTTTTRVRSPVGPDPRTWMTWKVRCPGGRGGDRARLLGVLCYPVTALFSSCSPSQTRVCRVSDLTMYPSFLGALGGESGLTVILPLWEEEPYFFMGSAAFKTQAREIGIPLPSCPCFSTSLFGLPAENSRPSNYRHYSHNHLSLTLHLYLRVPSQCPWPSWNLNQVEVKTVMCWRLPNPWSRASCSGRRAPAGMGPLLSFIRPLSLMSRAKYDP